MSNILTNNFKQIRLLLKMSQVEFSKFLNITRGQLTHYESGGSYPSIETLTLLSDKIKVPIDDIIRQDIKELGKNVNISDKENRLKDSEILQKIIEYYNLAVPELKEKLEYKTPDTIYHVLNGNRDLPKPLKLKLQTVFKDINPAFLDGKSADITLVKKEYTATTDMNKVSDVPAAYGDGPNYGYLKLIEQMQDKVFELMQENARLRVELERRDNGANRSAG